MKAIAAIGILLALAAFLPSPAAAQQSAALTIILEPPEEVFTEEGQRLVYQGVAIFTADYTAVLGLMGVPVTYTVSDAPEWTSVVISPATDVFPLPSSPGMGPSYTVAKTFTVTVGMSSVPADDVTDTIEVTATTTPTTLGKSATGKANAAVIYDAPEEVCPEHGLTSAQMAAYAEQASDALAEYDAARDEPESEVTTQSTGGATPLSLPWMAVAAFALVGAGVGLVLRRRLNR